MKFRYAFLLGMTLGLCSCGTLTPRQGEVVKDAAVAAGTAFFGPIGGLVADHFIEGAILAWMVQRKVTEKKRYRRAAEKGLFTPKAKPS